MILFTVVLSLAVQSVFAQQNRQLAGGAPPLMQSDVNGLIDFYEWLFEAGLSEKERLVFAKILIRDHKKDARKLRENLVTVSEAFAKVLSGTPEEQIAARNLIMPDIISDLQNSALEEDSALLLGVYNRGKRGGDAAAGTEQRPADSSSSSLIGKWFRTDGQMQGDGTGKTTYQATEDYTFEFAANGTVRYSMSGDLLVNRCRGKVEDTAVGTYSLAGNTLTIVLSSGTQTSTHSCEKKENFKRPFPKETIVKQIEIRKIENMMKPNVPYELCVSDKNGEVCFDKIA